MTVVLALSICRTEAGEDLEVTVAPGTDVPVTFSAEQTQPLWTLTVTPASGWTHKPETVRVNSSRWFIETPGGGCDPPMPAQFECDTAYEPVELQFQDRIFNGELELCTSSPGGSGGGTIPGWEVIGKTEGGYFVLPDETNIWLGSSATFLAEDGCANPMLSSWSSMPSLGTLPDGYTVSVTPEFLGKYTIMGTDKNNSSLSDAGELKAVWVDLKSVVFTSDHTVLIDYNDDFVGNGTVPYAPRGWVNGGANNPVSHTRDQNVSVTVTVCAKPSGVIINLRGLSSTPGLEFGFQSFVSKGIDQPVTFTSSSKLLPIVDILNESISWEASLENGSARTIGSSGPHKIYVSCGNPGSGPTLRRINWVCTKARFREDEEYCADAIWDAVEVWVTPGYGQGQAFGWHLLDGAKGDQYGDCHNQARCMQVAVDMLGIRPVEVKDVHASTNAGAGNCLTTDTRTCSVHQGEELKLDFPSGLNEYEGCCQAVGSFYAITPKKKAADDYQMLKKLGDENSVTQVWCYKLNGAVIRCDQPDARPPIP